MTSQSRDTSQLGDAQSRYQSADLTQTTPQSRPGRRRLFGALAASVAAVGASLVFHRAAHARGPGHHGGFMRGPMAMDPEVMGKRIDAMVAYALAEVDASPEQKSRISAIAKAAAGDLMPLRQQHRDARQQMAELFAAPTLDRGRFEALRVNQIQLADTLTRRISQALMDAGEVLTAQQRAALVQKWQQRHSRGRREKSAG